MTTCIFIQCEGCTAHPWAASQESHALMLRILIFSMVGVAAAITEMLVNRKDQKLYHKLGFLLRIAL